MEYMKILIVNKILVNSHNATGNTLRNIFSDMPDVEWLQYSLLPLEEDYQCADNMRTISNSRKTIFQALRAYLKKKRKQASKASNITSKLISGLDFLDEFLPGCVGKNVRLEINAFKPDLIYTLGADIRIYKVCRYLSKKYNIPVVVHHMDDFYNMKFTRRGSTNLLRAIATKKLRSEYVKIHKHSIQSLAIGPKMKFEYECDFHIPFEWVMNCVAGEKDISQKLNQDVRLLIFSGGLHMGRGYVLKQIAEKIENTSYMLEIYTSKSECDQYKKFFDQYKNTKLFVYVERSEMFNNISRADVLLHVESSKPEHVRYFRLSMSTKIPEYFISNKPIVCVGSQEIGTVGFLKDTGAAVICENVEEFVHKIDSLAPINERENLVAIGRDLVDLYFNKSEMQKRIYNVFCKNIEEYKRNTRG